MGKPEWKGVKQAIWGRDGLSGEAGMEGGGADNLGWKRVKWGSQNGRGWRMVK